MHVEKTIQLQFQNKIFNANSNVKYQINLMPNAKFNCKLKFQIMELISKKH